MASVVGAVLADILVHSFQLHRRLTESVRPQRLRGAQVGAATHGSVWGVSTGFSSGGKCTWGHQCLALCAAVFCEVVGVSQRPPPPPNHLLREWLPWSQWD